MRFKSFEIRNFRGIKHAKLDLTPAGAGIFTLIGLNESGKTTILEAISSFQFASSDEKSLYQTAPVDEDPATFVPKHEKHNFTGEISITALVEFEGNDKEICIAHGEEKSEFKIDRESIPDEFTIVRGYKFENSDEKELINTWNLKPTGRKGKARKSILAGASTEFWRHFTAMVAIKLPEIVYFPTFLFEQPDRIVLNPKKDENAVDRLYRSIIENVGASLPKPINIKTHIVDRIIQPDTPLEQFAGLFGLTQNKQQQIESSIDQLSSHLTETVFDSWSKVFGRSFTDREVRLRIGVDKFDDGSPRIYLQILLKDGKQQYDITERSLGFRWFFSFLLFTLYRRPKSRRSTLFLLDEPASNLHSRAQTQLLESFPRITSSGNRLMYSTHSHYLINPEWLDQAFIVSNLAVDYDDVTNAGSGVRSHTDIMVERYRGFVGKNPDKTTYFQPVLDRLQVIPSRLDSTQPCVLVEGKGDYLILKHGLFVVGISDPGYAILPTRGANHFDEIVSIMLGWGINFALCFDNDAAGRKSCKDFVDHWGIPPDRAFTWGDVDPQLKNAAIEDLLSESDLQLVQEHYGIQASATKSQVQLFFSENLALKNKTNLSSEFRDRLKSFDKKVCAALGIKRK